MTGAVFDTVIGGDAGSFEVAIASARAVLGLDAQVPARTWLVARTRPGTRDFVLVVFGDAQHASAVAAVDPIAGEVLESARLPGRAPYTLLSAAEARQRAGLGADTQARLVWDPSAASRSPFYPLWQLQRDGHTVWVDSVRGTVWTTLDSPKGGGSAQP